MSVHLRIEEGHEGLVATISQRDDEGKAIGHPSIGLVTSAGEAKELAKTLARSLGLKAYGIVDKTKSVVRMEKSPRTVMETGTDPHDPPSAIQTKSPL